MPELEAYGQHEAFGEAFEYRIVRSPDATEPRIDVDIHEIKITLPIDAEEDPHELVAENARWIVEKKRKYDEYREQAPERAFEEGETWPFLGKEREILVDDVPHSLVLEEALVLAEDRVEESSIKEELEHLYRREARKYFEEAVAERAEEMGVSYESIALRNQRTRWGSCSAKENLSFNWRLMMAPREVIDYVIVHELVHLKERNHTRRFWRIVKGYCEGYKEKAEWLEGEGVEMIFEPADL
jgi:predicted metal-dependent hydrolase